MIFGFLPENLKTRAVAVAFSMACAKAAAGGVGEDRALSRLAGFQGEFYLCLTRRADALSGLADAVLCENRRVTDLVRLSLVPECGRGHGGLYDGLNAGRVEIRRLRRAVAGRADQPGAAVLPCARAREERRADVSGVAVLVRTRAGAGMAHLPYRKSAPQEPRSALTPGTPSAGAAHGLTVRS
jgi:hypothetical protein